MLYTTKNSTAPKLSRFVLSVSCFFLEKGVAFQQSVSPYSSKVLPIDAPQLALERQFMRCLWSSKVFPSFYLCVCGCKLHYRFITCYRYFLFQIHRFIFHGISFYKCTVYTDILGPKENGSHLPDTFSYMRSLQIWLKLPLDLFLNVQS